VPHSADAGRALSRAFGPASPATQPNPVRHPGLGPDSADVGLWHSLRLATLADLGGDCPRPHQHARV